MHARTIKSLIYFINYTRCSTRWHWYCEWTKQMREKRRKMTILTGGRMSGWWDRSDCVGSRYKPSESTYIGPLRERRGPPMGPTSASTSAPISIREFAIQRDWKFLPHLLISNFHSYNDVIPFAMSVNHKYNDSNDER